MTTPTDALKAGVASLRESGAYSDFTVTCGSQSFAVHKAILGTQSEYFKTVFKTGTFKEGEAGKLELKAVDLETCDPCDACDDPKIVKLMIDYFYQLDYWPEEQETSPPIPDSDLHPSLAMVFRQPQTGTALPRGARKPAVQNPELLFEQPSSSFGKGSVGGFGAANRVKKSTVQPSQPDAGIHLVTHALVYAAAVKYQVPALKMLAVSKFKAAIDGGGWDHPSMAKVIPLVHLSTDTTSTELRDTVKNVLLNWPSLVHKREIEQAVDSVDGLAWRLFKMKC